MLVERSELVRKLKNISLLTMFFTALTFVFTSIVSAVSDDEMIINFRAADSIMIKSSGWLYDDFIRAFGWGVIRMLVWLNNYLEGVVMKVITLNDFYSSSTVVDLIETIKPIVVVLFVLAVFVLGYMIMINKVDKRNEIIMNILLAVSIVAVIPNLMLESGKLLNAGIVQLDNNMPSLADGIVKSNVADLKYYAQKGFDMDVSIPFVGDENTLPRPVDKNNANNGTSEYKFGNTLPDNNADIYVVEKLDTTEKVKKGGISNATWYTESPEISQEMLKHKMIPTGNGDGMKVVELSESQVKFTQLGKESYYRYKVNWGVTIFSLLITSFALAITIVKIGRAVFDLAFHQIFGMFIAVTDLTGGQRIKKVLTEIFSTFAVIFIMVFILQLFILYCNWVNTLTASIGAIGVLLMLIAGAWAVMDAPDIVERVLGIDAGLRSGYGALMGAYAGTRLAGGLAKGVGKVASAGVKGTVGGASFAKGMANGIGNRGSSGANDSNVKEMPDGGGGNPPNNPPSGGGGGGNPPINPPDGGGGGGNPPNNPPDGGGAIPNQEGSKGKGRKIANTNRSKQQSNNGNNKSLDKNAQIPSGYTETNSGIVLPTEQVPTPTVDTSIPSQNDQTVTPSIPEATQQQSSPSVTQTRKSSGEGIVTGNRYVQSVANVANRSANSGHFVGRGIRRVVGGTGRATGKAVVGVGRVVSNPRSAMNYAGAKAVNMGNSIVRTGGSVIGKSTESINTGKEKVNGIVKEIRTPFGK